jgi:hypothetical protein
MGRHSSVSAVSSSTGATGSSRQLAPNRCPDLCAIGQVNSLEPGLRLSRDHLLHLGHNPKGSAMPRPVLRAAFASLALAAGLVTTAAASAHAAPPEPAPDETFVVDVCPFPMQVHDAAKWFKEIETPNETQDHYMDVSVEFTNLVTGKTWRLAGNVVVSWVFNSDGSATQTADGVLPAYGPLHTVYYGHWTRVFPPDGAPGPIPFVGSGRAVDICQRLG